METNDDDNCTEGRAGEIECDAEELHLHFMGYDIGYVEGLLVI